MTNLPPAPSALEAECNVVGYLMVAGPDGLQRIERAGLDIADFGHPQLRALYGHILDLAAKDEPTDAIALDGKTSLKPQFLDELTARGAWVTAHTAEGHARLVVEVARKRRVYELARNAIEGAVSPASASAVLEDIERGLAALSYVQTTDDELKPFSVAIQEAYDAHLAAKRGGAHPDAAMSGLTAFDRRTGGILPGQVMTLGARPSMGKSLVGLRYAINVAQRGRNVLFVSLEMLAAEHGARALAAASNIEYSRFLRGDDQWVDDAFFARTMERLQALPIYTADGGHITPSGLLALVRRFLASEVGRSRPLGLVLIDHGGLVSGEGRSDHERANSTVAAVKTLAQTHRCPILQLWQLNRGVEGRDDRRPSLKDLRDTGRLEENSHIVAFLYREAYYAEREAKKENPDEEMERQFKAGSKKLEIDIQKNRNGSTGRDDYFIDVATGVVKNWEESQ